MDLNEVRLFLAKTRRAQGLTQSTVARRMGRTHQNLGQLENATGSIQLSTLIAWAAALGLQVTMELEAINSDA